MSSYKVCQLMSDSQYTSPGQQETINQSGAVAVDQLLNVCSSQIIKILGMQLAAVKLILVLGFNDMSTLLGHFVSSPREREKR